MLAYFTQETVLPPLGLITTNARKKDSAYTPQQLKDDNGLDARSFDLGFGNGMSCLAGAECSHSKKGQLSCLYAGGDGCWPDLQSFNTGGATYLAQTEQREFKSAASWLQALLHACEGEQLSQTGTLPSQALDVLGQVDGPFAFIAYDAASQRLLAARDRCGKQDLFWGVTADGHLIFSSSVAALEDCNPTATAFPAGSVFVSARKARAAQPGKMGWTIDSRRVPGCLHSFVKTSRPPKGSSADSARQASFKSVRAVPRVNSQGCLCGAVYRVASDQNLANWGTTF